MILIVDDNLDNLEVLATLLDLGGVQSNCVSDPTKAVSAIETLKPALVILDQSMPMMTGTDVLRVIRDTPAIANVPVIFYSAGFDGEADAMRMGAISWIIKGQSDWPALQEQIISEYKRHAS